MSHYQLSYSFRRNSIRPFSSRQDVLGFFRFLPFTSQLAKALVFISRSTSAYTFVVSSDTCPSHARIVLMSTPERRRWVAVVWRIVCGLTRLAARLGTFFYARATERSTSVWMPKARDRSAAPIEEDVFAGITVLNKVGEFTHGLRPQRAPTRFVAFATDQDAGQVAVGHERQRQVADADLGSFIGASAGVVQEQEQRMIATTLSGRHFGRREHEVQLRFLRSRAALRQPSAVRRA